MQILHFFSGWFKSWTHFTWRRCFGFLQTTLWTSTANYSTPLGVHVQSKSSMTTSAQRMYSLTHTSVWINIILSLSFSLSPLQWQECPHWSILVADNDCYYLWVSSPGEDWLGYSDHPPPLECLCCVGDWRVALLSLGLLALHIPLQAHALHWTLL